ncbi:MAG: hypothetical protein A3C44_07600 [Gammaproteobacteria bacterium RIFCSPHIGHO2_02_FULL_39_13]|nr:MAG: hypothetical protein A3C44_07600 [Gammaproteobacteria bacterium RIFCSPHIGHO2_02_FULL_39_13]OGT48966.1 MAG: hypothetical protein A3E53_01580 [Gammaproteobacteria bacterium RIFCSPHIGHO2_12_FULL_39_24]
MNARFIRFLLVGGLNTLFGYAIFSALVFLNISYLFAALGSTVLGVIFNFFTISRLVFKNDNFFLRFCFLYLVLYFLNIGIIHLLHDFISDLYLDGGIAIVLLAFASYYANKHFVFRNVL